MRFIAFPPVFSVVSTSLDERRFTIVVVTAGRHGERRPSP
jgi:hypothetical protein